MSFLKDFFLLSHHNGCRTGDDDGGFKWPNSLLMFKNIFCSCHMVMMMVILVALDGRLTDWEHGPPPKIIVSDFNFFSKLGKIGLKKILGGVSFPHWTFFSPGASFSQWTFQ